MLDTSTSAAGAQVFNSDPKRLKIGGLEFIKVVAMTESSHLENAGSEDVCDGVNIVAWLYDNSQASDWHNWHTEEDKKAKLKAFDKLYRDAFVYQIEHKYLLQIGFKYGKIIRRSIEVQEDLIIVSMNIEQWETYHEKKIKKTPPVLSDGSDSSQAPKATSMKENQAQEEATKTNGLLKMFDDLLKKVWD